MSRYFYFTCENCVPIGGPHDDIPSRCKCYDSNYPYTRWEWDNNDNAGWVAFECVDKTDLVQRAYRHGLWSEFTSRFFNKDKPYLLTTANMDKWYDRWVMYKCPPIPLQNATLPQPGVFVGGVKINAKDWLGVAPPTEEYPTGIFKVNPKFCSIGPELQKAIDNSEKSKPIIGPKDSFELRPTCQPNIWGGEQQEPGNPVPWVVAILACFFLMGFFVHYGYIAWSR